VPTTHAAMTHDRRPGTACRLTQHPQPMGYRREMTDLTTKAATPAGWTFTDGGAMDWQPIAEGAGMKVLGIADGKMIATFKFEAGYIGGVHHHEEPEFSYILEGSMMSQGVQMDVGHAYAAQIGTTHDDFRTENGCTLVSVFKIPS
jgi:hypothetical protein